MAGSLANTQGHDLGRGGCLHCFGTARGGTEEGFFEVHVLLIKVSISCQSRVGSKGQKSWTHFYFPAQRLASFRPVCYPLAPLSDISASTFSFLVEIVARECQP